MYDAPKRKKKSYKEPPMKQWSFFIMAVLTVAETASAFTEFPIMLTSTFILQEYFTCNAVYHRLIGKNSCVKK
ncbi:hypothetical protein AO843_02040 [Lysinibacillus sp. ZYM-1]|nr:hypothetical protein AO843_02040 [Lysinibacillus sp. ZYM-1]